MTNQTPSGLKRHGESTKPESHQMAKIFFSDGLFQNYMNLSWQFSHKTAAFYSDQSKTPLHFHNSKVSQTTHSRSMAS